MLSGAGQTIDNATHLSYGVGQTVIGLASCLDPYTSYDEKKRKLEASCSLAANSLYALTHAVPHQAAPLTTQGLKSIDSLYITFQAHYATTAWNIDTAISLALVLGLFRTGSTASPLAVPGFVYALLAYFVTSSVIKELSKARANPQKLRLNSFRDREGRLISDEVAQLLQSISANAVMVSAIAMFNAAQMDVVIRRLLNIDTFAFGIIDTHRILRTDGIVHTQSVFATPARLFSRMAGGLMGSLALSLTDRFANMLIYNRSSGKKREQNQYAILRASGHMLVMATQMWLPYAISSHYVGFACGGLSYALRYIIDDLTSTPPQSSEDWGNLFFRAAIGGALGMMLYPILPLPMIGLTHFDQAVNLSIVIGAIDSITKQFVLPALSDCKMTWQDKVDLAIAALMLGACIGFTINAATHVPLPEGGYMSMATGFAPYLPGISSFILYLIGGVIARRLHDKKLVSDFGYDVLDQIFGCFMIIGAFNMVLDSGAYKVVIEWLNKQALQSPGLSEFLQWHQTVFGTHIMHSAAMAFCMSFMLMGMIGIQDRLYQSVTHNDKVRDNRPYISVEMVTRFTYEMMKYELRALLMQYVTVNCFGANIGVNFAYSAFAHTLAGFIVGMVRNVIKRIVSPDREEKLAELGTLKGILTFFAEGMILGYDQFLYFVLGFGIDQLVPALALSGVSAAALSSLLNTEYFLGSLVIELSEIKLGGFSESIVRGSAPEGPGEGGGPGM